MFPQGVARPHRADKQFLKEKEHKKLLNGQNPFLLTEEALHKHDILTGALELRQFACEPCNHQWWKSVFCTKRVSTCPKCHIRYDALGPEKEFGIGRFICLPCDHIFYAWCEATGSEVCFKCHDPTGPPYINPRFKPTFQHRLGLGPGLGLGIRRNRTYRKIINASTVHDSTGSTVSTCLTQDLGPDIDVPVVTQYDYDYAPRASPCPQFQPVSAHNIKDGGEVYQLPTTEDVSGEMSRKRTVASDSEESDEESGGH